MKLALVGVGDAGGRLVDEILSYGRKTNQEISNGNVIAINTNEAALNDLRNIPKDHRVRLGELHPDVTAEGVMGNVDLAVDIAREELNELRRAFDPIPMYELDGIVVISGLAGGTGSGIGSVLVKELQNLFDDPVYMIGILPAEEEGNQAALTASRSLLTIVPAADNVLLFDNESWFSEKKPREGNYESVNRELAIRVVTLFGAGEHDDPKIPENCIDPSDIIRTFETGGISSIGYAERQIHENRGILKYLRNLFGSNSRDSTPSAVRIKELVQHAVRGKLTVPCEVSSAERIVIIVTGPPEALSRKGFENARFWLEEQTETVEIRAGDEPRQGASRLSTVVLFSNVTDVPLIDNLQSIAVAAQRENEKKEFGWNESSE